ncbi:unnamed protein product [Cuscuta campestris]|uniref:Secreted protein n=1 Tax=Cuscuta campestris TaxID=132261 RepID=A0A484LJL0_9ASTE|nr:unnamed protein product [Cuscuta campestris]
MLIGLALASISSILVGIVQHANPPNHSALLLQMTPPPQPCLLLFFVLPSTFKASSWSMAGFHFSTRSLAA